MKLAVAAPVHEAALARVLAPGTTACMLPAAAYIEDAVLAWERTHLFADAWVCAGRSADLAAVGAQRAVEVGDDAVLLVRGEDGVLRGFANVCQHRAHELAPCGVTHEHRSIHCPYHGWRYGLDGALLSTPHFAAPARLRSLAPRAGAGAHRGVARLGDGQRQRRRAAVGEFLAGIEPHVADHEPERLVVGATHSYEVAANWKLVVENYQECVHCPHIHPELCRVSPPTSGENHLGHDGFWVGGWQDLMPHAVTMSLDGASPTTPLRGLRGPRRRIDYIGVLPNMLVSLHPDYVMTHRMAPVAPDRTAVECQWLFVPEAVATPGFDPASPSTSGTSRTARTGRRASRCSAACRRVGSARDRSPSTRTPSPSSCAWWRAPTAPAGGCDRDRRCRHPVRERVIEVAAIPSSRVNDSDAYAS